MSKIPKWGEPTFQFKMPGESEFTPIGRVSNCSLSAAGEIPHIDADVIKSKSHELEFLLNPDPETERKMNELRELIYKDVEKQIKEFSEKVWAFIEEALRTRVKPPIKGEITPGKIRYRGLKLLYGENAFEFIGIIQRNKTIYCVDGKTYDITKYKYEKSGEIQVTTERAHC